MKLKFFGVTILTGDHSADHSDLISKVDEASMHTEGLGAAKGLPGAIIVGNLIRQIADARGLNQAYFAELASRNFSSFEGTTPWLPSTFHELASVVSQELEVEKDRVKRLEGELKELRPENDSKDLALRLVHHGLGDYAGNESLVGRLMLHIRRTLRGQTELLAHERGNPVFGDAVTAKDKSVYRTGKDWKPTPSPFAVIGGEVYIKQAAVTAVGVKDAFSAALATWPLNTCN